MISIDSLSIDTDDIFILATGTSLTDFDYSQLDDRFVIALNDAGLHYPKAALHFYGDELARRYMGKETPRFVACGSWGSYLQQFEEDRFPFLWQKTNRPTNDPRALYQFATNIASAIHLASRHAKRVYLLGFDAYRTESARYCDGRLKIGRKDYHPVREIDGRVEERHHQRWHDASSIIGTFVKDSTQVYNLSTHSKITTFPKLQLQEALKLSTDSSGSAQALSISSGAVQAYMDEYSTRLAERRRLQSTTR